MKHLLLTTIAAVALLGCGNPAIDRALIKAAAQGNIEAVKQHLAYGADVNEKDEAGLTPLLVAARNGHKEIVELLILKGVDVNENLDPIGTSLDWAKWELENDSTNKKASKNETAELLRKHGAKTKKELESAESIHDASKYGNIEAVKQHLDAGSDVNAKDNLGATPLHWATVNGHKEIVELLIANGADVNAKDDRGMSPLDWAVFHPQIEDLLRKHDGKTGEELKAEGK